MPARSSATMITVSDLPERKTSRSRASCSRSGSTVSDVAEFAGFISANGVSENSAFPVNCSPCEESPKLVDSGVQICVDHNALQLLASNHFSLLLQEHNQHLKGLILQAQLTAIANYPLVLLIDLEKAEAKVSYGDRRASEETGVH
jgi:hypothetical protein